MARPIKRGVVREARPYLAARPVSGSVPFNGARSCAAVLLDIGSVEGCSRLPHIAQERGICRKPFIYVNRYIALLVRHHDSANTTSFVDTGVHCNQASPAPK